MTNRLILRVGLAALVLGLAVPGSAAVPIVPPASIITLGPASFQVQACEWEHAYLDYKFSYMDSGYTSEPLAAFRVEEGAAAVSLTAPVHLPEGAQVTGVIVNYYDSDPDTEPSMGLYAIGTGGRMTLIVDTPGQPGFAKGEITLKYAVKPAPVRGGMPYEFRVTLNRSLKDPSFENALFRVQVTYRMPLYLR